MMSHIESSCRQEKKKKKKNLLTPSFKSSNIHYKESIWTRWCVEHPGNNRNQEKEKTKQFKLNLTKRFKNYPNTCFEAKIKLRNDLMQSQVDQDLRKIILQIKVKPQTKPSIL